ncbi:Rrf2 family transcriptional regulator [Candidatus Saccharibacteria bacterium]|nr:Rrf2 family transcriptional regulator [Candidatus Saccharibacteria bacterium]
MPKLVTSRGDYGLLLMAFLSEKLVDGPQPISKAANYFHLPQPFLEQIALDLRRAHLLGSRRGKGGGYFLVRSPERISVIEVIEALEGPLHMVTCQLTDCVAAGECLTRDFWLILQRHLHKTLREVTLADLVTHAPHQLLPIAGSVVANSQLKRRR